LLEAEHRTKPELDRSAILLNQIVDVFWTCLEKVESFPWMKGELDDEAEGIYARV
jgi:hypothetical protein